MTTVQQIEQLLFDAFPAKDAMQGDRIGLLVGSREAEVRGIALALDAKVKSIEAAAAAGCNLLVTHHPVFWYPPTEFLKDGSSEGASVLRAAELGVSLISMHTNLDSAPVARELLLEPGGFVFTAPLSLPSESDGELQSSTGRSVGLFKALGESLVPAPALGQLGIPKDENPVLLKTLGQRYKEAFGAVAKVWGDPEAPIKRLATCSGGAGDLVNRVISTGADCFVTGEVAYHEALNLDAAGVALIELGHDRSELPYRYHLKRTLLQADIDESLLHILEPVASWWN